MSSESTSNSTRRKATRFWGMASVVYQGKSYELSDLSLQGLSFRADHPPLLEEGQVYPFILVFPSNENFAEGGEVRITGIVKRYQFDESRMCHLIGIQFEELHTEGKMLLERVLSHLEETNRFWGINL